MSLVGVIAIVVSAVAAFIIGLFKKNQDLSNEVSSLKAEVTTDKALESSKEFEREVVETKSDYKSIRDAYLAQERPASPTEPPKKD